MDYYLVEDHYNTYYIFRHLINVSKFVQKNIKKIKKTLVCRYYMIEKYKNEDDMYKYITENCRLTHVTIGMREVVCKLENKIKDIRSKIFKKRLVDNVCYFYGKLGSRYKRRKYIDLDSLYKKAFNKTVNEWRNKELLQYDIPKEIKMHIISFCKNMPQIIEDSNLSDNEFRFLRIQAFNPAAKIIKDMLKEIKSQAEELCNNCCNNIYTGNPPYVINFEFPYNLLRLYCKKCSEFIIIKQPYKYNLSILKCREIYLENKYTVRQIIMDDNYFLNKKKNPYIFIEDIEDIWISKNTNLDS
jgi:hypothetical protein